jgi:CubicO group peptidase (beta-lactamase class C family)
VGAAEPASTETVIRSMKGKPLQFDPGQGFNYSNFGYVILGRVIERVSGMTYRDYVRTHVLQPVGANRTQQGRSHRADALAGEVQYYSPPSSSVNAVLVPSVFPGEGMVPVTYGGYHHEAGDASGAWVSSTIDLLRLVGGIDGRPTRPDILSGALIGEMTGSGASACGGGACFYGAGWFVRPIADDADWWHGGSLPGTTAMLVRTHDNVAWIGLFNGRTVSPTNSESELDATLWKGFAGVTSFPTQDRFGEFQ